MYLHTPLVQGLLHEVGLVEEPLGDGLRHLPVVGELDGLVLACRESWKIVCCKMDVFPCKFGTQEKHDTLIP